MKKLRSVRHIFAAAENMESIMENIERAYPHAKRFHRQNNVAEVGLNGMTVEIVAMCVEMSEMERESMRDNLSSVLEHFTAVETKCESVKDALLRQIAGTRSMLQIKCYGAPGQEQADDEIFQLARTLGGVVLADGARCFLDAKGRVILTDEGESELGS